MKRLMVAIGGGLLGLALLILGREGRKVKRVESQRDFLIATRIKSDQDKAERLNKQAEKHKQNADIAAAATIKKLEELREKDQDMDDLLSAWQSTRVRQRPG
jgi:hypothetical protein